MLSNPSKVSAFNAYDAVDATPVIVPRIVPWTHRLPVIVADPVIYGELILIYLKYFYINTSLTIVCHNGGELIGFK